MSGWSWLVVGLVLLMLEMLTPGLFLLFFGAAGVVVGVVVLLAKGSISLELQLALFCLLSIVSLLAFRGPLLRRLQAKRAGRAPVDAVVGARAVAREAIAPGSFGQVEFRGTVWQAKNASQRLLEPNCRCRVVQLEGLTLWVEPEDEL